MIYVNNFRYGKISKKMAGRFDAEQYNQGAFTFRNCRSLFEGGVTRRPPLRHLTCVTSKLTTYINGGQESFTESTGATKRESNLEIYVIHGFTMSSSASYLIGLGKRTYGTTNESVFVAYEYGTNGALNMTTIKSLSTVCVAKPVGGTEADVLLNDTICQGITFSQYYDRLYVASHDFRPFVIDYEGTPSAKILPFYFNSNAKGFIKKVKDDANSEAKGRTVIAHIEEIDGEEVTRYYYDTDYNKPITDLTDAMFEDRLDPSKIAGFNDFEDNSFGKNLGDYPSIVAVINDSLWYANTTNNPNVIWKSRTLGSSQWIGGLKANTMQDFSQFQVVATAQTKLKDSDEWPTTIMKDSLGQTMYYQYGGADAWFSKYSNYVDGVGEGILYDQNPSYKDNYDEDGGYYRDAEGDIYYTANDGNRLIREAKYYIAHGGGKYFVRSDNQEIVRFMSKDEQPKYYYVRQKDGKDDEDNELYKQGITHDGFYIYEDGKYIICTNPDVPNSLFDYGLDHWWYNYDWYWFKTTNGTYTESNKASFEVNIGTNEPFRKKYETFDMSTEKKLWEESSTIDFVATDSCSVRMELNTGMLDAIRFISSGCDKIVIGTSNAEWSLPSNFSAVSNYNASRYSGYGANELQPINLNRSVLFVQKGNLIREFYMYQSYLMQRDATAFNHDLIPTGVKVIDAISKNAPDPVFYLVLSDGRIIQAMYDADAGLNSFSDWDIDNGYKFKSVATVEKTGEETIVALIQKGNEQYLCEFYAHEEDKPVSEQNFSDEIVSGIFQAYKTEVETSYIEINNQAIMFGRNKKTKGVWLRPYHCGKVYIGNDERQMTLTNYALGDTDYHAPVTGKADMAFSMFVKSHQNEPMTILAFAWEVEQ